MQDQHTESNYISILMKIDVNQNQGYNRWAMIIETVIIVAMGGFYVHFIKRMLETKRLLMWLITL